ncbi:conserved exported hypothetical protein [Bradyrhizobium sp. STM 3843]|uniref:hypothetical protein n=1 Tax=Bradyrhizobium sp. STM 3843 TaxID=551947 RepID=UPI000240B084|nr:hypothetical protein [Bradyrhizobium sp. STM 3843]CCE07108.1 conserved exported hypothetical protein [Bradyrhizobium sp. STM 3843]
MRLTLPMLAWLAGIATASAGFSSPESLVRNVYAHYGQGTPEFSAGLQRDQGTARQFFDPSLAKAWSAPQHEPYDFLVQSLNWKLGPVAIAILRRQFDRTYVSAAFDNRGRRITMNFIVVKGPDGWVIWDVETPHDSLRSFLEQFRN